MKIIINTEDKFKYCPVCGRLHPEEFNFCPRCENENELLEVEFQ